MSINIRQPSIPAWLQTQWHESQHSYPACQLTKTRQESWHAFVRNGLPGRKDESWKYADLSFLETASFSLVNHVQVNHIHQMLSSYRLPEDDSILLVLVNGCFIPALSEIDKLPNHAVIQRLGDVSQEHAAMIQRCCTHEMSHPFVNLNAAMWKEGLFLYIPDECEISLPIHLLSIATDNEPFIAHTRHVIVLGERACLTLVEDYIALSAADYMMNLVTTILVNKQAKLNHYKIQQESKTAIHMAYTLIEQRQDSDVAATHFSSGSQFARDDIMVKLQESGASCQLASFYHTHEDHQYIDYHIDVDHAAHNCRSEMLYKGILDKRSCAVFNGRVLVRKEAQKTLAYQANHNLLLSKEAEIYSKPMLEIYANDVKCKHGATIGQLDQDALFYLSSRGVKKREAFNMLLHGFTDDIVKRVLHPGIKQRVQAMVQF